MLRKSKILDHLRQQCAEVSIKQIEDGYQGISAAQLSELLQMDRANISKELNVLFQEEQVLKVSGRPVYYFDMGRMKQLTHHTIHNFEASSLTHFLNLDEKSKKDDFERVIGSDGSLKTVIKKAKAAMIYPPFGLHTLLIGPTGSGKTMFAEIMFNYARKQGVLKENSQFIVFNCAEYVDNPQLLLGQLFGYVKGAYTGADTTSEGLVAKADNGILFLDEVHRLPPEGQEMLFMLIDRGEFRRLGETEGAQKASVLIIAATTENVDSTLLTTFLRRIPMTISMPSLQERSLKERFGLIEKFFRQEFNHIKMDIQVQNKVMKALLAYECPGNIGQLKADVRMMCARGYLDYITNGTTHITINTATLPDNVYAGLFHSEKMQEIETLLHYDKTPKFHFNQKMELEEFDFQDPENVYEVINQRYESCVKKGMNKEAISISIMSYIQEYISHLLSHLVNQDLSGNEELYKIVSPRVYKSVEVALQLAEQKLSRKIAKKVYVALALHISAILENEHPRGDLKQNIYDVVLEHPNEYQIAKYLRAFLETELDIELAQQETVFLTMFLSMQDDEEKDNHHIGLLVLAHGNGVARNMVDVANTLLKTEHGHALDMRLKQSVEDFLKDTSEKVKEIDEGKGVLLLVDMGSLLSFGDMITQRTGILVRTIDMVSTPFVLEALRKTMMSEYELEDLYRELRSYIPYVGRSYSQDIKQKICNDLVIISTCLTGEGAAVKLGRLLSSALPLIGEYHIEIIPCNAEGFDPEIVKEKRVLAVVGAIDLYLEEVPYISSDRMILGDGIQEVHRLIIGVTGANITTPVLPNFVVNNLLNESLVFLDPIKANEVIYRSFHIVEKMMAIQDYNRILISYVLHMGCMIERCIKGETMEYKNAKERLQSDSKRLHAIKSALAIIEDSFQIKIPDTEVSYVFDIFDTE